MVIWEETGPVLQSWLQRLLLLLTPGLLREFTETCDSACFSSKNRRLMLVPWRKFCGSERETKSYAKVTFLPNCCAAHKTN